MSRKTAASVHSPFVATGASALSPATVIWIPWVLSVVFNLGIFFSGLIIVHIASLSRERDADEQIIIPTSFTDPALSEKPGITPAGTGDDPSRDAAQNNLKDVLKSDGWAQVGSAQNLAGLLEGQTGQTDIEVIARGSGGSIGAGTAGSGEAAGGPIAPYGTPGGGGAAGFKSSFYGTGGNANRIVYIIDHSGSMVENFEYLRLETKRSVTNLLPIQFFSVIMVSETASVIGMPQLRRATKEVKEQLMSTLDEYVAEGKNDDLLPPFQEAFEKAFAMRPQLVYFLTDGHFDPQLIAVVQKLNADHKVHINTLAFVNHDPSYEDQLRDLAKKNGGVYKFISEHDAQGQ